VDGKFGIGFVLSGKTLFMHVLQPYVQAIALILDTTVVDVSYIIVNNVLGFVVLNLRTHPLT
jgi:hypothetical protein